ncbi:MAG: hypothetical protein J0I77_02055 [Rudaea sp.]|uniref:hypothetical protein n=1 Tax=unclassified Rudaea TaxID=2627037 RepID=UPI0010F50744|nr:MULTISPECIES: hypothetical protein [unclassified Rudaea]MBN8884479.1 hypothetical protein [Rudaea sp.]
MSWDDESNELDAITANGWANLSLQNQAAAQLSRMRMTRKVIQSEMLCSELNRKNIKLEDENAALKAVMSGLLDRNTALWQVVVHLENAWQPRGADPTAPALAVQPMVAEKQRALASDPTLIAEKERVAAEWMNWGKAQVPPRGKRR